MSTVFERRSVRHFLPKPVEMEKLIRILRAGFEGPSAHNRRPWEFIVNTKAEDRKAIAEMSPYAKMVPEAALTITPCVNLKLGKTVNPEDAWWIQDLAAATENILLQIVEEGLGGVWLGWYPDKEKVQAFSERFKLPPHILPFAVVALGYPAKVIPPEFRFDSSKVHYGVYGEKNSPAPEFPAR
jgi:nitroreductase